MGLQHVYVPPHEQGLNEAEKTCRRLVIWDDAAAASNDSGRWHIITSRIQ